MSAYVVASDTLSMGPAPFAPSCRKHDATPDGAGPFELVTPSD